MGRRKKVKGTRVSGAVELTVWTDSGSHTSTIRRAELPAGEQTVGVSGAPVVRRHVRDDRYAHAVTDFGPNGEEESRSYRVRDTTGYPPR
jgi:hypothetical protein